MKEKIKSIGIALALVICVGVTACDNANSKEEPSGTGNAYNFSESAEY